MIRWIQLALLLSLVFAGCARKSHEGLIVGMELSYPPFEMIDETGKPAGISVDLAHALGETLHTPVKIENIPFDGLLPSLKTGRIDLILSSMTATTERAQSIDFSEPYLNTGLAILANAKSDVQSIDDLNRTGRTVVVKNNTTGHLYATEHLTAAHLLALDQESACVLEVTQGKADAFLYDQMSTLRNSLQNPQTTRPLLQPFKKEQWAIGIRKGNDGLRQKINEALAQLRANGEFDRLGDKWLKNEKQNFQKLGVPFVF